MTPPIELDTSTRLLSDIVDIDKIDDNLEISKLLPDREAFGSAEEVEASKSTAAELNAFMVLVVVTIVGS
jgi:hypothetical protein